MVISLCRKCTLIKKINILRKIPGFRSGKWWRALVASVLYLFGSLIILAIVNPSAPTLALDKIDPTNKSSVSINGKTSAGEVVYLLQDDQEIQSARADSKGKFYFLLNDLKDGNYTYTVQVCRSEKKDKCNTESVKAVDNVDNESETVTSAINFNPIRYKAKVARVVDGDTIKLETGEVVRYIGIDTPETVHPSKPVQCYGKEASQKNKELVEGKEVKLEKDVSETDKYGRLLRYIWLGDMLVNEYLVREGYAHSSTYPPDVKYQDKFIQAERQAREERKGLWGDVCSAVGQSTQKPIQTQTTPSQTQ